MTTVLSPHPDLDDNILFDRSARTRWRIGFDRWIGRLLPLLFLVAILPILGMVYWVSEQALPTLTWTIIVGQSPYATDQLGVPIIGTFELMLIATLLSVVLGLFGGVATAELLSPRAASVVRMTANMLVGTPSVIIGFFGFFVFVLYFGWGLSLIAGAVTLSMFMTPYIFRTADLAFTSVPRHIREAALGSGAAPTQYILRIATPIALPQILTGIFLAMAIGVGETAPIVLTTTAGKLAPTSLTSPVTFLTAIIWDGFNQGSGSPFFVLAFQAAFLLMVVVVALNIVVRVVAARYQKRLEGLYQ
ncbi:MAG: ABC transporter permease subunit [Thermoplasmata archaeon]|jgi:phosphate transport system permease protein